MHALLLQTPGLAPAAQAKAKDYQPLAPPVTAEELYHQPPAHTNQPCTRKNQEPWYSAPSCRALPTSHVRSVNYNRSVI